MKKSYGVVAVFAAVLGWPLAPAAQEAQPSLPPEVQEYMEKYATPAEHHHHLEMLAGKWTTKSQFWMAPGAPVMESTGKAEHKMVLGGRFLETSYEGEFAGTPFAGMGIAAYDRYKGKYVETWVDSMGTMVMVSEGSCDGTGKSRTVTAHFDDPMTGKPATMRSVYTIQDANHYTLEMFGTAPDGSEYKLGIIDHTRVM